ncbi:MAG: Glutamate racemase [Clostridia bacterium]|jgi:glutamate racemase|nr:Glutamate racemase [Clostridia bacterium]
MQIGFFDSGIGGLTVLHDALNMLPQEDYIYYADTLNVPYGSKTKADVKQYVFAAADFIVQKEVKALVIACNTGTSVAIEDLRIKYPHIPIIGMEPAIKPALKNHVNKRILVTATPLTLKEEKLKNLITTLDNENMIDLLPLPGLVHFAEKFEFDKQIISHYLREQLSGFDLDHYGTLVLGCTHFTFYKDVFTELLPAQINIIDGNKGTVANLKRTLERLNRTDEGTGQITFYHSNQKVYAAETLERYSHLLKRLDQIN